MSESVLAAFAVLPSWLSNAASEGQVTSLTCRIGYECWAMWSSNNQRDGLRTLVQANLESNFFWAAVTQVSASGLEPHFFSLMPGHVYERGFSWNNVWHQRARSLKSWQGAWGHVCVKLTKPYSVLLVPVQGTQATACHLQLRCSSRITSMMVNKTESQEGKFDTFWHLACSKIHHENIYRERERESPWRPWIGHRGYRRPDKKECLCLFHPSLTSALPVYIALFQNDTKCIKMYKCLSRQLATWGRDSVTTSAETRDQHLIVLIDEIQAAVPAPKTHKTLRIPQLNILAKKRHHPTWLPL